MKCVCVCVTTVKNCMHGDFLSLFVIFSEHAPHRTFKFTAVEETDDRLRSKGSRDLKKLKYQGSNIYPNH